MKAFTTIRFDPALCARELSEYDRLLTSHPELRERRHILPFFSKHINLSALIGTYHPLLFQPTDYAFEFPVLGDFTIDLALRDTDHSAALFVEFEDGCKDTLFKEVPRYHSEWGARLEHGCGQLIDWLWKLADQEQTKDFELKIGRGLDYHVLLVAGRSRHISETDRVRLQWRFRHTLVNSKPMTHFTYDELSTFFHDKLKPYGVGIAPPA